MVYDLEERTLKFAKAVRIFIKSLARNISNIEDAKQLVRSSGSVAANYIEANESLSRKDFVMRIKICRKEAKESLLWLNLLEVSPETDNQRIALLSECTQLMKIFGAILEKTKQDIV